MPKTTRIHASYRRVIQTQKFFTVEVQSGFDEEVTYSTEAELDARRAELRDKAMSQLLGDLDLIQKRLGVEEKRVFVSDNRAAPNPSVVGADLE